MNEKEINRKSELLNKPVGSLLMKMALPMVVAMVVNGLYYLVDAAFVGRAVNSTALAGLAVVFPVQMLAVAIATMTGVGSSSIISMALGKGDREKASSAVQTSFIAMVVLGLLIPLVMIPFREPIMRMLGATDTTLPYAESYYSVIIPGIILVFISFLEVNTIRAEGNAKLAAFGMFLGSILNIAFDALFIFGFRMGTAGAAWGTVAARFVTTIMLSLYYISGKSSVRVLGIRWKFSFPLLGKIVTLGIGPFLNQLSFSVLAMVMNILLARYGTDLDMSVYGVFARIFVFITLPFMGIAQGFQPIVGFNYGAGKIERIRKAVTRSYIYTLAVGLVMFVIILVIPEGVMGLFTDDAALIQKGAPLLRTTLLLTPVIGWHMISYFYFMSLGKPVNSLFISLFRQLVFIIPLLIVLTLTMGYRGIWISYPIADAVSVGIASLMMFGSLKKLRPAS